MFAPRLFRLSLVAVSVVAVSLEVSSSQAATLVAHYQFENNNLDSAGTNHGTSVGTISYETVTAPGTLIHGTKALKLVAPSGSARNYVNVPDAAALDITGAFTLTAWANPTTQTVASGTRGIVSKWSNGVTNQRSYGMALTNAGAVTGLVSNTGLNISGSGLTTTTPAHATVSPAFLIQANTWQHLAFVYEPGASTATLSIYADGVLVAKRTDSPVNSIFSGTSPLWIGMHFALTETQFVGLIDDVRVYNGALSASEVAALVPEPASLALLGIGALLIVGHSRRA